MTILICPNSFKESLSSLNVTKALSKGLKDSGHHIVLSPLSDGGEGFLAVLKDKIEGEFIVCNVKDPWQNTITAGFFKHNGVAYIETAKVAGLELVSKDQRKPLKMTSYGLGQLITNAIKHNCTKIIVGLGGSATVDGGIGMLLAMGVSFLTKDNLQITCPEQLPDLAKIELDEFKIPAHVEFIGACDVTNPLLGENGAAHIFGPQKGATKNDIDLLENGLIILDNIAVKSGLNSKKDLAGAGAAGGLGYAMATFLGAKLVSGSEVVSEAIQLENKINDADLVITGEGRVDEQSLMGKSLMKVVKLTKSNHKKIILVAGEIDSKVKTKLGEQLHSAYAITDYAPTQKESMIKAEEYLVRIAQEIVKNIN